MNSGEVTSRTEKIVLGIINSRTDGGPGHLSTDGGVRITAPPEISKMKQARDTR